MRKKQGKVNEFGAVHFCNKGDVYPLFGEICEISTFLSLSPLSRDCKFTNSGLRCGICSGKQPIRM